jgi:NAD-dependent dihydropyrimidine dehydrogenase PreA subunit
MVIDHERCLKNCRACVPYCTMGAISYYEAAGRMRIDQEECVECGQCLRANVCPAHALVMPKLAWPRILRSHFSNPLVVHPETGVPGRGTEEMKTNEVTGRFRGMRVGMAVEMGRPGIGTRFHDIEKITMAVAQAGVHFDPRNPLTCLMEDVSTGVIRADVLNEKVLSAIIGFDLPRDRIASVLVRLKDATTHISTVFSLDLTFRLEQDNEESVINILQGTGFRASGNGKVNVGLGRPLAREE